ncbi:MAG: Fic family protein [Bacteroidota bacterium]
MIWNWQRKNWPDFTYNKENFADYERQFLDSAGIIHGSIQHIDAQNQQLLKVDLISNEAFKTSEIEGEILNRDSLQSSIRKHFGLKTDQRKVAPAEQGIAEVMVDLYQNHRVPLSDQLLFTWHQMLTNGRRDLTDIGRYRTHEDAMQIVSGEVSNPTIHFEAPPSTQVHMEMQGFIDWFNQTDHGKGNQLPALVRAGIAHLYFECIHPFEDGNGRIGRAISEKSLSQSLGRPTLIAISYMIEKSKKDYYAALERNNSGLEVNDWLYYFCETVLSAQDYTQKMINFIIEKGKFYRRFKSKFNERQGKVVERMFREGVDGFKGGLSAKNYRTITGTPSTTATRDLSRMVEIGAFKKTGELKSTRYYLAIEV